MSTPEKIAIITRIDERYIYIWDSIAITHELRFPLNSVEYAQPGDLVWYIRGADPRDVQFQNDIRRYDGEASLDIIKTPHHKDIPFLVKTLIVFPPKHYELYRDRIKNCEPCKAIAYSLDFREVAVFVQFDYVSDVVYEAYICRIPGNRDFLVPLVQTLFCVILGKNKEIKEFFRIVENKEALDAVPWRNRSPKPDVDFTTGLSDDVIDCGISTMCEQPQSMPSQAKIVEIDDSTGLSQTSLRHHFANESRSNCNSSGCSVSQIEPSLHASISNGDLPSVKDDKTYGLLVRLEENYAVLWSKTHGLVCAKGPSGYDRPLGVWVNFKCREDYVKGKLTKSAYDLEDITPLRISYKFDDTVKCQAIVRLCSYSKDFFLLAEDDVFGVVLCSRDPYVMSKFKCNFDVEVFVIFVENFHGSSNWVAIGANHGRNDWRKMENLPVRIEEMADLAFAQRKQVDDVNEVALYKNAQNDFVERRFGPPIDWHCAKHVKDQTIEDALGVVICHENDKSVSVAFTIFGLARLKTYIDLGTWLRMMMEEELECEQYPNCSALTPSNYRVLRSEKIPPVMSTRVISPKGDEKVLLCGVVGGHRRLKNNFHCLENVYLGEVIDEKCKETNPKGFLVEFSAFNRRNGWCWEVLQNHGIANDYVDHVPLEMSIFCQYMGRTCDDAHTLMINPTYVDPESKSALHHVSQKEITSENKPPAKECVFEPVSCDNSSKATSRSNSQIHVVEKPTFQRSSTEIQAEMEDLQKMTPTQCLFMGKEDTFNVLEELRRYKPNFAGSKTRGMCLITKKHDAFALAYSKKFQIVLIKSDIFENVEEFHTLCRPGNWINACFSRVQSDDSDQHKKLHFDYIAVPSVKPNTRTTPFTRLTNGFVQVYISVVFNENTVSRVEEEPSQLIADTALGLVLIAETLYKKNEFHNTEQSVWVTHIRKKYGCHWKFVLNDTLADFDYKFQLIQKHLCEEKELREANPVLPDLSTLNDFSLISQRLAVSELLAGFGSKRELSFDKEYNSRRTTAAKLPTIAELAIEELQSLKRKMSTASLYEFKQTEISANEPAILTNSSIEIESNQKERHCKDTEKAANQTNGNDNNCSNTSRKLFGAKSPPALHATSSCNPQTKNYEETTTQ